MQAAGQGDDQAGVQPAGEERPDRLAGWEAPPDGALQALPQRSARAFQVDQAFAARP